MFLLFLRMLIFSLLLPESSQKHCLAPLFGSVTLQVHRGLWDWQACNKATNNGDCCPSAARPFTNSCRGKARTRWLFMQNGTSYYQALVGSQTDIGNQLDFFLIFTLSLAQQSLHKEFGPFGIASSICLLLEEPAPLLDLLAKSLTSTNHSYTVGKKNHCCSTFQKRILKIPKA